MLGQEQIKRCTLAVQSLLATGMKPAFLPMAISQIAHETAGFNSKVALTCNNLSGIKYIAKPYQKATACTGSPEGNNYAKFASYDDWAKDYIRILSRGYMPIDAKDIGDFAYRLKQNGYYTDSVPNYKAGLTAWYNKFSSVIEEAKKKQSNDTETIPQCNCTCTCCNSNLHNDKKQPIK